MAEQPSGLRLMKTQGMAQDVVTGGGVQKISGHCGAVGQTTRDIGYRKVSRHGPVWHLESIEVLTSLI